MGLRKKVLAPPPGLYFMWRDHGVVRAEARHQKEDLLLASFYAILNPLSTFLEVVVI